ncbi:MAG: hypothetical protein WCG87_01995 [Bacteroidota bacterium]
MDTPILLMVFNRPETTQQVFNVIRMARPKHLYVAADGPRADIHGETERCEVVRKIVTAIDWDCELHTLFRDKNLGCGHGPSSAISWFFDEVEQGIILEDDCVPDQSFFSYCTELLEYYKDNDQIMHISGNNFVGANYSNGKSYYFNNFFTAWGWATWRRAWKKYDFEIPYLDDFIQSKKLEQITMNKKQLDYWRNIFELVRDGKRADIWDYQWLLTCWYNDGLAITPVKNLVTNIGFGADATHTVNESRVSYIKSEQIKTLVHPTTVERNRNVDSKIFTNYFEVPQHLNNIRQIMYKLLPNSVMMQVRKIRRRFFPNMK